MSPVKLHIITTPEPLALLRLVRLLASEGVPCELGSSFVKFPRGDARADALAALAQSMGFKPVASMDRFSPDTQDNMAERVGPLLAHHQHDHACGHDCGHDHHKHP
jgi:hypothetical protein